MDRSGSLARSVALSSSRAYDRIPDVEAVRNKSAQRLAGRWDAIFDKYAHDFTGRSDIIDLETGRLVENRGHLAKMTNERDVGTRSSYSHPRSSFDDDRSDDELGSLDQYHGSHHRPSSRTHFESPSYDYRGPSVTSHRTKRQDQHHETQPSANYGSANTQPQNTVTADALAQLGTNIALQIAQMLNTHGLAQLPAVASSNDQGSHSEKRPKSSSNRHPRPRHSFPDRTLELSAPRNERTPSRLRPLSREPSPIEFATSLWDAPRRDRSTSPVLPSNQIQPSFQQNSAQLVEDVHRYSKRRQNFSRKEDETLWKLRHEQRLPYRDILHYLPGRDSAALHNRYKILKRNQRKSLENGGVQLQQATEPEENVENLEELDVESGEEDDSSRRGLTWSKAEDDVLWKLRAEDRLSHREVARHLPGRDTEAVMNRYKKIKRMSRQVLESANVENQTGIQDVEQIQAIARRESNENKSDEEGLYKRKNVFWTQEEDKTLWKLYVEDGLKFRDIIDHFPGRSVEALANRHKHYLLPNYRASLGSKDLRKNPRKSLRQLDIEQKDSQYDFDHEEEEVEEDPDSEVQKENEDELEQENGIEGEDEDLDKDLDEEEDENRDDGESSNRYGKRFTSKEDDLLLKLRFEKELSFSEIQAHLPGRDVRALHNRIGRLVQTREDYTPKNAMTRSGKRFAPEEDELLLKLHMDEGMPYKEIVDHIPGRDWIALQNRFKKLVKERYGNTSENAAAQDLTGGEADGKKRRIRWVEGAPTRDRTSGEFRNGDEAPDTRSTSLTAMPSRQKDPQGQEQEEQERVRRKSDRQKKLSDKGKQAAASIIAISDFEDSETEEHVQPPSSRKQIPLVTGSKVTEPAKHSNSVENLTGDTVQPASEPRGKKRPRFEVDELPQKPQHTTQTSRGTTLYNKVDIGRKQRRHTTNLDTAPKNLSTQNNTMKRRSGFIFSDGETGDELSGV